MNYYIAPDGVKRCYTCKEPQGKTHHVKCDVGLREEMALIRADNYRLTEELADLRKQLDDAKANLEDATNAAAEAEVRCAEEWEKDCARELRKLAELTGFEGEVDGDTADVMGDHVAHTVRHLTEQRDAMLAERDAALQLSRCNWDLADQMEDRAKSSESELAALRASEARMREALERVIGDHHAPADCYSTGPLTGNPIVDSQCPSCEAKILLAAISTPADGWLEEKLRLAKAEELENLTTNVNLVTFLDGDYGEGVENERRSWVEKLTERAAELKGGRG